MSARKRGAEEITPDNEAVAPSAAGAGAGAGGAHPAGSREGFLEQFTRLTTVLCDEILPTFEMTEEPIEWVRRMTNYTVPTGKLNRGLTVVHAFQSIMGDAATPDALEKAGVLGWCVEWLQACFLVADDVMDESPTRRGKPCWYKLDEVKMIAINDAFLLRSSLFLFLKKYFRTAPYYGVLLELFNETIVQTELGQLLDLTSSPIDGTPDLTRFTTERHRLIVKYKTSFYSFYLPVALAMVMAGETDEKAFDDAKDILTEMGVYFQVQDDYLDCYGKPETIGKIGTDIQDNKCGWLVVQALDRVTAEQKKILQDHYGRNEESSIQAVKALYLELGLEKLYFEYEEAAVKSIKAKIAALSGKTPPAVFQSLLDKIYKREK